MSPIFDVTSQDGTHIAVIDEGSGQPILIVHPGGGDARSWSRVARGLASRFRVLRFDRRPYRTPGGVAPDATMANEVNDVVAIAKAVGDPVLLVGHSSGAVVALEAALASPSSFAGMALYEPPVTVNKPLGGEALARAEAALKAGKPGLAMKIHLLDIVKAPRLQVQLLSLFPPIWRQVTEYAAGQITDSRNLESLGVGIDRYAPLTVPALLIGGARSPRHLGARLAALRGVLPEVDSVSILERQGHLANAFAPDRLADIIGAFADRVFAPPTSE
ncbi:MAG TPA: alpha/beta hydrolase [Pseudonocardiaceae bacterium]